MKKLSLLLLIMMLMGSLLSTVQAQTPTDVYSTDPEFAHDWMQLTYDVVKLEALSAPAASRVYGYMGVTLYESLLNGIYGNYSIAGTSDTMPDMPLPEEGAIIDWATVANIALANVLTSLMPTDSENAKQTAQMIEDLKESQLAEHDFDAEIMDDSMAYGEEIAKAMIGWISEDGYGDVHGREYTVPTGVPSYWIPTNESLNPVEPYWGELRPFVLRNSYDCSVALDVYFDTASDSTFYQQALEVKNTVNSLTPEQQGIALYWIDTPGITGAPSGHWMMIARQVAQQQHLTLDRVAEMYARVGMAVADSFISAWEAKYRINLIRPVTYIRQYIRRSWGPFLETPMFPEYPSGHSVVSAAAAEVLTQMFGPVAFVDETHLDRGLLPRSYTSFWAAANEAGISRLYGGIHYRAAIENGIEQGKCVGANVMARVHLQPVFQGE